MKLLVCVLLVAWLSSCGSRGIKPDTQVVADNQLVIVKEKESIGVFRLFNQTQKPETTQYEWSLFKVDPEFSLNKIETGEGFAGHDPIGFLSFYKDVPIKFGSFKYKWSINTVGRGWVYFIAKQNQNEQSYCIPKTHKKSTIEELVRGCTFTLIPN